METPASASPPEPPAPASPIQPRHWIQLEQLRQLQALSRRGFGSSEFALVGCSVAMVFLATFGGKLPASEATLATTVLGSIYAIARSQTKSSLGTQIAAVTDKIEADPAHAVAELERTLPTVIEHATIGSETSPAGSAPLSPGRVGALAFFALIALGLGGCSPTADRAFRSRVQTVGTTVTGGFDPETGASSGTAGVSVTFRDPRQAGFAK